MSFTIKTIILPTVSNPFSPTSASSQKKLNKYKTSDKKTSQLGQKKLSSKSTSSWANRYIGSWVFPAPTHHPVKEFSYSANRLALAQNYRSEGVHFTTKDGIELEGMHFNGYKSDQPSNPTVILFNANCGCYEWQSSLISQYHAKGMNVLVFNHRGVLNSKGKDSISRDGLIKDGIAAVSYLKKEFGVKEKDILLHGTSLGGGISVEVALRFPKVAVCNERSFASLKKTIRAIAGWGIGNIGSYALSLSEWEYDSEKNWKKIKGPKWIIAHPDDGIIRNTARLADVIHDGTPKIWLDKVSDEEKKANKLSAKGPYQYAHNRALTWSEFNRYFALVKTRFPSC